MNESSVQEPFAIGELLLGKYQVERILGRGGMGIVLAATHLELKHRVAIKLLSANWPGQVQFETRFLREAQAAASLRSENVVRVFDVGRLETGTPYMVMEWLEGHDLERGPKGVHLPIEEAVDYVIQACDAMSAAHAQGLIHRDLKPANLFLTCDEHGVPIVKVLDFGISKVRQGVGEQVSLTQTNGVMGSPLYMAPEQIRSARDVDARADIWSLGTILYELIAGEPPFGGETLGAVLVAVTSETPVPLRSRRPETPEGLEAVVQACLRKDPEDRVATMRELQQALLPYGSLRSQAKMAIRQSGAPMSTAPPPTRPAELATQSAAPARSAVQRAALATDASAHRRFLQRVALLLGALGIAAALGYVWLILPARRANVTGSVATTLTAPDPNLLRVVPTSQTPAASTAPSEIPPQRAARPVPSAIRRPQAAPRAVSTAIEPARVAPQPTRNPLNIEFK